MDINAWINKVIKGPTGFETWEDLEFVVFHNSREEGIAAFVIRCLANPKCEGSGDVLAAIYEQRNAIKCSPKCADNICETDGCAIPA